MTIMSLTRFQGLIHENRSKREYTIKNSSYNEAEEIEITCFT